MADPDTNDQAAPEQNNPPSKEELNAQLMQAAAHNDGESIKQVEQLLKNGADAKAKDSDGFTALMYASMGGNAESIKLLLENGAEVNATYKNGYTPLMFAAQEGKPDAIQLLLDCEATVNATDKENKTALDYAKKSNRSNESIALLQDATNADLIHAAAQGDAKSIKQLLAHHADAKAKDADGFTALMYASMGGNAESIKLLLENGAEVNAADKHGYTALMLAADKGNPDHIKLLLDNKATASATDKENKTALDYAKKSHRSNEGIALLEDATKSTESPAAAVVVSAPAAEAGSVALKAEEKDQTDGKRHYLLETQINGQDVTLSGTVDGGKFTAGFIRSGNGNSFDVRDSKIEVDAKPVEGKNPPDYTVAAGKMADLQKNPVLQDRTQQLAASLQPGTGAHTAGTAAAPKSEEKENPIIAFIKSIFESAMGGIMALFAMIGGLFNGGHNAEGSSLASAQQQARNQEITNDVAKDLSAGNVGQAAGKVKEIANNQGEQAEKAANNLAQGDEAEKNVLKNLHGSQLVEHAQHLANEARGLEKDAERLDKLKNKNQITETRAHNEHEAAAKEITKANGEAFVGNLQARAEINRNAANAMQNPEQADQVNKLLAETETKDLKGVKAVKGESIKDMLASSDVKEQAAAMKYVTDTLGKADSQTLKNDMVAINDIRKTMLAANVSGATHVGPNGALPEGKQNVGTTQNATQGATPS